MIMKLLTFLAFMYLSVTVTAQTPSIKTSPPLREAAPSSVGMSAERLDLIGDMCNQAIQNGEVARSSTTKLLAKQIMPQVEI